MFDKINCLTVKFDGEFNPVGFLVKNSHPKPIRFLVNIWNTVTFAVLGIEASLILFSYATLKDSQYHCILAPYVAMVGIVVGLIVGAIAVFVRTALFFIYPIPKGSH